MHPVTPREPFVALLAEGVDRNFLLWRSSSVVVLSPSSRRAWIEIARRCSWMRAKKVALLAEGVDRNLRGGNIQAVVLQSPSSRRAWIEI